ncbi:MAG: hypothetical protein CO158_10330 [Piscirickettsiaceae bacterium CG_4_9_14_3_um_filter_43_564]|nr:MAG: hypothetical protein COW74_11410 [Piscirickettsiaceae bacterium CG18_big_fil_WC_8_21_14_2_50_44_103]PIW57384.1 MAG: hypothetical protein COW14_06335 [Piscirickettsiaceae bacterium CG12_big_fil_rev_8_21_14_0_65_44_934]PIW77992.1 MAG: hypothetical protein CO000_04075 [Piscirickettsiaceae bacterium CG_4_8_14_3_um_filter_44_38]PIX80954.1 MAG: hypothetical protein COZ36_00375 [Piscirickettsiaceae bacterium CG_4_10_14_3_um_filter_44_349]PIY75676.1 MAG: hypothetical protein COY84_10010 [Piscir
MNSKLGGKYILGNSMTPAQALESIGKGLKQKRIQKRATQEELASHAGVSLSLVKRLESGKSVATENLVKIMTSLEVLKGFVDLFPESQGLTPQEEWEALQKKRFNVPKRIRKSKEINRVRLD